MPFVTLEKYHTTVYKKLHNETARPGGRGVRNVK